MKKTLSILGCGWLGSKVIEHLGNSYTTIGTGRSEKSIERIKNAGGNAIEYDINTAGPDLPKELYKGEVLMIALPPSKVEFEKFETCIEKIPQDAFKQIILISSTGIYKDCNQKITENSKEIKTEGSLFAIERACQLRFRKTLTILRMGGLIGPGRNPANFLHSERIQNNPRGKVNLVHSDDCVKIIEKVIEKELVNKRYNVVMDDHPTKKEFYSTVAFLAGKNEPKFDPNGRRHFKIISNEKIKKELDYQFMDIFDAVRSFEN